MNYTELQDIDLKNSTNKTADLFNSLSNKITSKTLPSGYVFPNENNMCQILSIGRGTLREVYKALELKGFITRSKAGTVVNDLSNLASSKTFDSALSITGKEDLIEYLLIVDPEVAALAAKKVTDEELNAIYEAMMKLEDANHRLDTKQMNEYNALFHRLIRESCHNPILISSIYASRKKYDELIVPPLMNDSPSSKEFMDLCLFQHYNLYYALKTHDEKKAKQIMYEHFVTDLNYYHQMNDDTQN